MEDAARCDGARWDEATQREDERLDEVSENFDLLFSRVEVIGAN